MKQLVVGQYNPLPPGGVGVRFTGRGWDYFRIWAGDLLFMMLTLGFYWPWLRRRRWQFFNANTWIGDTPLGDARLMTARGAWPRIWQQLLLLVGIVLLLRHTRLYGLFGWVIFFGVFSLGGPWWLRSGWQGRIGQLYWQGEQIRFDGSVPGACRAWGLMVLSLLPAFLMGLAVLMDASGLLGEGMYWSVSSVLTESLRHALFWSVALSIMLALAGWFYHALRYGLRHIHHPVYPFQSRLRFWPLLRAAAATVLLVLPLPFLIIGLLHANWPLLLATFSIEPPGTLQTLVALAPAADSWLGGLRLDGASMLDADVCVGCRAVVVLGLVLLATLLLRMGWRYFMARVWNQSWRSMRLPGAVIESHLPAGRLMATGFVCDLLTIITGGLYHPFALVRLEALKRQALRVMPVYAVDGGLPDGGMEGSTNMRSSMAPAAAVAPGPEAQTHTQSPAQIAPCVHQSAAASSVPLSRREAGEVGRAAMPKPRLDWRLALGAIVVPALLLRLAYGHAKPMLGHYLAQSMPAEVADDIGARIQDSLRRQGLAPSGLSEAEQQAWRERIEQTMRHSWQGAPLPPYRIVFARGGKLLGPNALVLPGSTLMLTDELMALAGRQGKDRQHAIVQGVVAHQLAHLSERHLERTMVMVQVRRWAWAVATGKQLAQLSGLGADSVLQQGYVQAEQQAADEMAIRVLKANGHSPRLMLDFLRALQAEAASGPEQTVAAHRIPISLASQGLDARRVSRYEQD
ncbi:MAG: DUF898 family protein [Lautropia sp.]|nr:DUF898 family protein [Lautropia sp.]